VTVYRHTLLEPFRRGTALQRPRPAVVASSSWPGVSAQNIGHTAAQSRPAGPGERTALA
jgi:hypothetical protein